MRKRKKMILPPPKYPKIPQEVPVPAMSSHQPKTQPLLQNPNIEAEAAVWLALRIGIEQNLRF
jgi:hypothetical protein